MNKHLGQTIVDCYRDNRGRLIIKNAQGKEYRNVHPARMFPITDPNGWISIRDSQRNELLCIESIDKLPDHSRRIFEEELNRRMFTPVIQRVTRSKPDGDNVHLFIITDRGPTEISVDPEDIYRLTGNRVLIKDLNGVRYLIPDWRKLNSQSKKFLDMYL